LPRSRIGRAALDADPVVIRPARGRKAGGADGIKESAGIVTPGKAIERRRGSWPAAAEGIEVAGVT
jgi:hypothetical protein